MSRRRITARRKAEQRKRWIRYGLFIGLLLIGGAAWLLSRPPAAPPVSEQRILAEQGYGAEQPIVTIVEYGDFNCPACQSYHQAGILQRLQAEYPEAVRVVYRHFPVITAASPQLAQAAECAADQGKFWEFHDELFARAPLRAGQVSEVAAGLELDMDTFKSCFDSGQYRQLVEAQTREAYNWGLTGTPSFVVNDQPLAGPPSYQQLEQIIQNELSN